MPAARSTMIRPEIIRASKKIGKRVAQLREEGDGVRADALAEAQGIIMEAVIEESAAAGSGAQAAADGAQDGPDA